MENIRKEDGAMILELAIVLPMFIIVTMFVYGLFVIQSADNQIAHALIQASKSLSMDPYSNEKLEHISFEKDAQSFWSSLGNMFLDFNRMGNDEYFSSPEKWYTTNNFDVVKNRFFGFFAGTEDKAAEKLKKMNIIDGINGLAWDVKVEDDNLEIELKYTIQFWFDAFNLGKIPISHKIVTKLWK